jgi:Protein of unknown function (DUF3039)
LLVSDEVTAPCAATTPRSVLAFALSARCTLFGMSVMPEIEIAPPVPALDGDHERMTHIVLEGLTGDDGEFLPAGPSVVEGIVNGTPVRALCGKVWVPGRDPMKYPLCPTCKDIAEQMGWDIPAS